MKLHFTADEKIDPELSVLFNRVAINIRESFVDAVEFLSRQNKDSLDWWVSSPASRNTLASPLFHYCCCIAMLQELIRKKEPVSEIITDSRAFKKILKDYLAGHGINARVTLARLPVKQCLKKLIRPIYVIFGLPLKHLLLFFIARQTLSLRKALPAKPLTLIDTFVMPGYIEKDRYYPGLVDVLSEKEKQRVWFVPHLYGFRPWQYISIIKQLRISKRNFILKEDYFKLRDYFFAWKHFLRIRALEIKECFFQGVDISRLVREEMMSFRGVSSSYTPLLNYRFAERLKQACVRLRLVINWFENQVIDKGFNAGFNHFFPDTPSMGYQGFIPIGFELNVYPTTTEKENKMLPMEIGAIGQALLPSLRKYCPDIKLRLVPAIRYKEVWENRKYYPEENIFTILIALSIVISEAVYILKLLVYVANEAANSTCFWIKPHPTTSQLQIKGAFGSGWPEQFEFVSGDFNDCVEKSKLLISSVSSACMESLAKGIPVIIIGNSHGLTYNPVPETITSDIWRLCYSPQEVADAIQFYQTRSPEKIKEHEEVGRRIREEYFEPVTGEGVRRFLGL